MTFNSNFDRHGTQIYYLDLFADTPTIISSLLSRQASTTSTAAAAVPKHQTTAAALSSSFVAIAPAKQQAGKLLFDEYFTADYESFDMIKILVKQSL